MKGIMGIMNGAPLPNWVKLVVLGAIVGVAIGVNQMSVATLGRGQEELRAEVAGLRSDMKQTIAMKSSLEVIEWRLNQLEAKEGK